MTKSLKDEAMEKLKAMGSAPIEEAGGKSTTPSAAQAFLGAVSAGVIAVILYKFTTTIEAGLNRQTFSDNFSVSLPFPSLSHWFVLNLLFLSLSLLWFLGF